MIVEVFVEVRFFLGYIFGVLKSLIEFFCVIFWLKFVVINDWKCWLIGLIIEIIEYNDCFN